MIIALNNKCNLTKKEFTEYQKELNDLDIKNNKVILIPSTLYLNSFTSTKIQLGSQNVSSNEIGAYTGEVAAAQLKSLNVEYSLVGHSERRTLLHENNIDINKKIKNLLKESITPIICVGETRIEKDSNLTSQIILQELKEGLKDLTEEEISKIIIAYEPIWAIGTGNIPSNKEIEQVFSLIKESYSQNKILYGGSISETNVVKLKDIKNLSGFLIGGLSLSPKKIQNLINNL